MKRKDFIYSTSLILAGAMLGCSPKNTEKEKTTLNSKRIDLHAHPGLFFRKGTEAYDGDEVFLNRVKGMQQAGMDAVFFSLVADWPLLKITDKGVVPTGAFSEDQGWEAFQTQLTILKELLSKSVATTALIAEDLNQGSEVKAYLACEGGDFIGSSIEHLDETYEMGLRSIQLVHYAPNNLGDLQTWEPKHNGLSDLGKSVVQKMNQLGMIIDVAHASMATVKDVVELSDAPIILSHSILQEAGSTSPVAARAISVDHAKMVANTGGVIGMWPSGYAANFAAFVDHTFRMIDAVGIDHVGMGTDMDANFKPLITDYSGFATWEQALLAKGLSEAEVNQLLGGNAQRVLEAVL